MRSSTTLQSACVIAAIALAAMPALAQNFRSGSNGSYGPIDTASSTVTLDVPADGIFHCTTIRVGSGGTLRFRRNALNTPVYLLATGDVNIIGTIDVSGSRGTTTTPGLAGPGGFDGGSPGATGVPAGDGHGPGAGKAGTLTDGDTEAGGAGYGDLHQESPVGKRGVIYGSPLLLPIIGGSGGGGAHGSPGWGGGGGGGAIVIASDTQITVSGSVFAHGGGGFSGAILNTGSGGAIRVVAPRVSGNGSLRALGDGGAQDRGDGRVRVDAVDRSGLRLFLDPPSASSVGGLMAVFPDPSPRLDIIEAAGRAVPQDTPTQVLLPGGSPATQAIKVRARDFGQIVPIRVVITPDSGPSSTVEGQIDNAAANPAEATLNVTIPANTLTRIAVYTR